MDPLSAAPPAPRPPLYLVDASLYVFRAWHSMPDEFQDQQGWPTNAVHGFARFLLDLIERGDSSEASVSMGRTLHAMLTDLDLRNEASSGQEHVFAPAMLQRPA